MKWVHLLATLQTAHLLTTHALAAQPGPAEKMSPEDEKEFQRGFADGFREAMAEEKRVRENIHKHRDRGITLGKAGDHAGAAVEFRTALDLAVKAFGPDHFEVHVSRFALLRDTFDRGQDQEYAQMILQMLKFWESFPDQAAYLKRIFNIKLANCGFLNLPVAEHTKVLQQIASYGEAVDDSMKMAIWMAQARFHAGQKDWPKAIEAYRRGISTLDKKPGVISMSSLRARHELALTLARASQFAEAEKESGTVLKWATDTFGPEHIFTGTAKGNHGVLLVRMGRHAEAIPALEAGFKASAAMAMKDEEIGIEGLLAYAQALRAVGRKDEAEKTITQVREKTGKSKRRKTWEQLEQEDLVKRWNETNASTP